MLLPIHIAAGGLAVILGAVALLVKKGGTLHRRSGLLFVYAILVMGTSAAILGGSQRFYRQCLCGLDDCLLLSARR